MIKSNIAKTEFRNKIVFKLIIVAFFAIAMGFLETSVVVYLRKIMYPGGFGFPLAPIAKDIAMIELLRESSTIVMLLTMGILAGRSFAERFAWFIYGFAIWDIFYYVFLKVLIDWPASLMTYDVLFLIPATWVGPVITPLIISLTMILFSLVILYYSSLNEKLRINIIEWSGLIAGSVILILAFIWDYSEFILAKYSFKEVLSLSSNEPLLNYAQSFIPVSFQWNLYIAGLVIIVASIVAFWLRQYRLLRKRSKKS